MINALGHIGEGLLVMLFFGLAVQAGVYLTVGTQLSWVAILWTTWAMQTAYWLGREKRDHEIDWERRTGEGITYGLKSLTAFYIWRWKPDGLKDFFAPMLVNALLPIASHFV